MLVAAYLFFLVDREVRLKASDNLIPGFSIDPVTSLRLSFVFEVVEPKSIPLLIFNHTIIDTVVIKMNTEPFRFVIIQTSYLIYFPIAYACSK